MKTIVSFFFALILFSFNSKTITENLIDKLAHSDSIKIVSHLDTGSFYQDSLGNDIPTPEILTEGKLNRSIILEEVKLNNIGKNQLIKIFSRPIRDIAEIAGCFEPHHAILIFKTGKISYIDICFQCARINTSSDIQLDEAEFDDKKWKDLKYFFTYNGLKYKVR